MSKEKESLTFTLGSETEKDKKFTYKGFPEKRETDFFEMYYKMKEKTSKMTPEKVLRDVIFNFKKNFPSPDRTEKEILNLYKKSRLRLEKRRGKKARREAVSESPIPIEELDDLIEKFCNSAADELGPPTEKEKMKKIRNFVDRILNEEEDDVEPAKAITRKTSPPISKEKKLLSFTLGSETGVKKYNYWGFSQKRETDFFEFYYKVRERPSGMMLFELNRDIIFNFKKNFEELNRTEKEILDLHRKLKKKREEKERRKVSNSDSVGDTTPAPVPKTNDPFEIVEPKPVKEVDINVFTLSCDKPIVVKLETTITYKDFFNRIKTVIKSCPPSIRFIDCDGDVVEVIDDQVLESFLVAVTKYGLPPDIRTYVEKPARPSFLSTLRGMFTRNSYKAL